MRVVPGPGCTRTARGSSGTAHAEHVTTGSKVWPHVRCSCSIGRPRLPDICTSPQCTTASSSGCRSRPLSVRRYSNRTRSRLIHFLAQHAGPNQLTQPIRQYVPRDAQPRLKFLEPAHAQKAVAQDQQRPAVADHRYGARHRAGLALQFTPSHPFSLPSRIAVLYFQVDRFLFGTQAGAFFFRTD